MCHKARHYGPAVLLSGILPRRSPAISALRIDCLLSLAIVCFFLLPAPPSFGQTSPATLPNVAFTTSGIVLALAQQDDGKVIVGGTFLSVNGLARTNIARLNADGSGDETWAPAANDSVRQILVAGPDIFVLGDFTVIGGQNRNGLAKL